MYLRITCHTKHVEISGSKPDHRYMNSLFTETSASMMLLFKRWQMVVVYKSDLTPKPGPLGGSVSEVKPPAGSHEKRPLLDKIEAKGQIFKTFLLINKG